MKSIWILKFSRAKLFSWEGIPVKYVNNLPLFEQFSVFWEIRPGFEIVARYFPSSARKQNRTKATAPASGKGIIGIGISISINIIGLSISSRITTVSSSLSPTIEFIAISGIIQGTTVFALHQDDSRFSQIFIISTGKFINDTIAQQLTTQSVQYPPSRTLIEQ